MDSAPLGYALDLRPLPREEDFLLDNVKLVSYHHTRFKKGIFLSLHTVGPLTARSVNTGSLPTLVLFSCDGFMCEKSQAAAKTFDLVRI
jgi:hypothetical protein